MKDFAASEQLVKTFRRPNRFGAFNLPSIRHVAESSASFLVSITDSD